MNIVLILCQKRCYVKGDEEGIFYYHVCTNRENVDMVHQNANISKQRGNMTMQKFCMKLFQIKYLIHKLPEIVT